MPQGGPYLGAQPGLLNPSNSRQMGSLSEDEQALVIVDVDPIHTVGTRPSFQLPLRPLEYVAHLPIFEDGRRLPAGFARPWGARAARCRCGQVDTSQSAGAALTALVASAHRRQGDPGFAWSKETLAVAEAAHLAELKWESLRARLACWDAHHLADRGGHHPPTMMDWLWVRSGADSAAPVQDIFVPAYAEPPGTAPEHDDAT